MKSLYRNILIFVVLASIVSSKAGAQDDPKLTIPSSPAFSILDYEPTAVLRPTSRKALASDILNSFDNQGKLLTNVGIEVSPYWLKSHPALTRAEYLKTRDVGQVFLQSLSISAASTKDSATGNRKLGAGFRFQLIHGQPVDSLQLMDDQLRLHQRINTMLWASTDAVIAQNLASPAAAIVALQLILQGAPLNLNAAESAAFSATATRMSAGFANDNNGTNAFLEYLRGAYMDEQSGLIETVSRLNDKRKGFVLEFAGATGFNNSHNNSLERAGLWVNASRYISNTDLLTATARYMFQNKDSAVSNFDLGIGYIKRAGAFNISLEALLRWWYMETPQVDDNGSRYTRLDKSMNYRIAAQASYMITRDISVNISFGKTFDAPKTTGAAFFSILGFNYSLFSNEPISPN